jgi:purine nucleosidase
MIPLLIDVDTGIDDAFGLLFALGRADATVIAVSTVAGNVGLDKATRNTRAVLALAGRSDIPVYPGCAGPLVGVAQDASDIHGATGLGHAELAEVTAPPASPTHAVDAIRSAARDHEGELVLIATGPLTNVAAAITRSPELVHQIKRLVLMGGAFQSAGNVTATAEFNIWYDPEAARIVFRAFSAAGAAPLIAIGLDVTRQTLLTEASLNDLAARLQSLPRGPAIARFLVDAAAYYFNLMQERGRPRALVMHDPLAVGVAIDPTFVRNVSAHVDVETMGELTRGMTVGDWRPNPPGLANAEVALEVDPERFLAAYAEAVLRTAG